MRIRDGHVSNSSSVSFVLTILKSDYKKIKEKKGLTYLQFCQPKKTRLRGKAALQFTGAEYLGMGFIATMCQVLEKEIHRRYTIEVEEGDVMDLWRSDDEDLPDNPHGRLPGRAQEGKSCD